MATRIYNVEASVIFKKEDGYTVSRSLPTFSLNADILGITDYLHAERIAERMLRDAVPDFENSGIEYYSISTSFVDWEPVAYSF